MQPEVLGELRVGQVYSCIAAEKRVTLVGGMQSRPKHDFDPDPDLPPVIHRDMQPNEGVPEYKLLTSASTESRKTLLVSSWLNSTCEQVPLGGVGVV